VAAGAAALAIYGLWAAAHAKLDVLPEFAPPRVEIQTEAPGLAPEQVEALVTVPIETSLGGIADLATLRSQSLAGLSVVTADFDEEADAFRARQAAAEAIAEVAARLPAGVHAPALAPLTSATMDVLKIGLTSDTRTAIELRAFADEVLRPRLHSVPGVARVNVFGGDVRQLQVRAEAARLAARGLTLGELADAVRAAIEVRGLGFLDTPNQRILVDAPADGTSAEALRAAVVSAGAGGAPIRIGDVAEVVEGPAPRFGDALIQGRPGVLLTLSAAYGANTLEVTHALESALAELAPTLEREAIRLHAPLHRPASFIESALDNLLHALLLGGALVAAVLVLLLESPRAALVSLAAIPLSLLTAVAVLTRLGFALDTMVIGGLAIAIGEVVDDAVIDVASVLRALRARAEAAPTALIATVLGASLEVRRAVVYATLGVALVFLPILRLGGIGGRFFAPLAIAYLLAIFASLGVALTVTPALCLLAFGRRAPPPGVPPLQRRAKTHYERWLRAAHVRAPRLAGLALALGAVALATGLALGGELLPRFREGHLVAQLAAVPGTSIDEMRRIGAGVSRALLALPEVASVEQQIGRAEQGEDTWGTQRSELHIELRRGSGVDEERAERRVRAVLAETPGTESEVMTFLGDRLGESLTGETAAVVIGVAGDDLDALERFSDRIAEAAAAVPGAVDVSPGERSTSPHLAIALHADALARYGLRAGDVLAQVGAALGGLTVGQVPRAARAIDVVVRLTGPARGDPLALRTLLVRSASGAVVPLAVLADAEIRDGRDVVAHEAGRRRQTVTCNVQGRDVASFAADLRARVAALPPPPGVQISFGGTEAARVASRRALATQAALGGVGILALFAVVAGNRRNLGLVVADVSLGLVGGVAAVSIAAWLRGVPPVLSLGSLVGFVASFGITSRNAILMVTEFRTAVEGRGAAWNLDTAVAAASERLIPILATALVTGLGLVPLVLSAQRPGGEIDGPMATVILGGLATSTLLNLFALPLLFVRFGRFASGARRADASPR
jgi:CzcA family heavy metal efflux pump